ncbi:hypothetical protein HYH03_018528 [Edaphochlamys debaryana]|uniref:Uncharacterized protein n=1 Tax=Edaphochlamys debaryana TaxID=47281 RepID=A0A835XDL3_9CHLO|nr:hypothetical protein HYH03_018528 [Edaphochlamys debaryana]|eukprot:KAG2482537.1 hypothetical protein HYH03_018528 [Edaphochlamys debaryana]
MKLCSLAVAVAAAALLFASDISIITATGTDTPVYGSWCNRYADPVGVVDPVIVPPPTGGNGSPRVRQPNFSDEKRAGAGRIPVTRIAWTSNGDWLVGLQMSYGDLATPWRGSISNGTIKGSVDLKSGELITKIQAWTYLGDKPRSGKYVGWLEVTTPLRTFDVGVPKPGAPGYRYDTAGPPYGTPYGCFGDTARLVSIAGNEAETGIETLNLQPPPSPRPPLWPPSTPPRPPLSPSPPPPPSPSPTLRQIRLSRGQRRLPPGRLPPPRQHSPPRKAPAPLSPPPFTAGFCLREGIHAAGKQMYDYNFPLQLITGRFDEQVLSADGRLPVTRIAWSSNGDWLVGLQMSYGGAPAPWRGSVHDGSVESVDLDPGEVISAAKGWSFVPDPTQPKASYAGWLELTTNLGRTFSVGTAKPGAAGYKAVDATPSEAVLFFCNQSTIRLVSMSGVATNSVNTVTFSWASEEVDFLPGN